MQHVGRALQTVAAHRDHGSAGSCATSQGGCSIGLQLVAGSRLGMDDVTMCSQSWQTAMHVCLAVEKKDSETLLCIVPACVDLLVSVVVAVVLLCAMQLDYAKRHLTHTITSLRRLAMLSAAVDDLEQVMGAVSGVICMAQAQADIPKEFPLHWMAGTHVQWQTVTVGFYSAGDCNCVRGCMRGVMSIHTQVVLHGLST